MCQTLFVIPREIAGISLLGFGWLLAIWCVLGLALLARSLLRGGWNAETRSLLSMLVVGALAIAFVLPWFVKPEGLPIRGYGVMLALAVAGGIALSAWRAGRVGLDPELVYSLATWLFVSGLVGARAFYVIQYWPRFQRGTLGQTLGAILNLTEGGLVVYGALLAGGAALLVLIYKHKLPGLALADLVAPGVVLGVGLGRLGCFLNGCCYGGTTDLAWAVQFPPTSPAYEDQARDGRLYLHGLIFEGHPHEPPVVAEVEPDSQAAAAGIKPGDRILEIGGRAVSTVDEAQFQLMRTYGADTVVALRIAGRPEPARWVLADVAPRSLPVHPTQLYSFIDALLLCLFLLAYEPYQRRAGELAAIVLTVHPISRFLLEIIRVDESAIWNTGMSIAQNISLAIFAGGVCLWIYLLVRKPQSAAWPRQALAAE